MNQTNISNSCQRVYLKNVNSRENLQGFLKTNYDRFFQERMSEQKDKTMRAAESFNHKHEAWSKMKQDLNSDYRHTTMTNIGVAITNQKLREQTENTIKYLEQQELAMVQRMQQTLAKKEKAF